MPKTVFFSTSNPKLINRETIGVRLQLKSLPEVNVPNIMARLPRLTLPGYPHHIIQRGNNRQDIFTTVADYQYLLVLLNENAKKFAVDIHAYVLMTNHFHLLATPQLIPVCRK